MMEVFKLQKSLYELKQASFTWNERFTDFLKKEGLSLTKLELCVFINKYKSISSAL